MLAKNIRRKFIKLNFRTIGKIGFLLVIIGFFMPVACDMNGPQIADYMIEENMALNAILIYLLLISAIAGLIIAVLFLMKKNIPIIADWIILLVCIISGLIVYFNSSMFKSLQSGAYLIFAGWLIVLIPQTISAIKKESKNCSA